jgi:aspartate/methionine/tyrosine aminotransferase
MLQSVLHELLTAPDSVAQVETARRTYDERQSAFADAMVRQGIPMRVGDGLNVWLPVADERAATVSLAASGIRVAPGGPFQLGEPVPSVRVTVGMIRDDIQTIAEQLAAAARID